MSMEEESVRTLGTSFRVVNEYSFFGLRTIMVRVGSDRIAQEE